MIRTYKRKLKLTKTQERRVLGWIGVCRLVHNMALEIRKSVYSSSGGSVHKFALMGQLPSLREGFDWIKDVPSQTLQAAIERLDGAYTMFFKGEGFPKFASKKRYKSLLLKSVKVDNNFVILPKIGRVRMFKDSDILGRPKTAIIKVEPAGFFIYIQCDDVPKKFTSENQAIGLDMGIAQFYVDSNGNFVANPKHFQKHERRLRIENRALARKKKGSNRWIKQAKKLAKLHYTVRKSRRDFLHKESTRIAKGNSVVYLEDLSITDMARSSPLSKSILDCGWGMFRGMLEYKTNVVPVDPNYTSQTCSVCGSVDKNNRVSQSLFVCGSCGHTDNADFNAAKNIFSRGTAVIRKREALACALGEEPRRPNIGVCQVTV